MSSAAEIALELEHYLAPAEAERRARLIMEDMAAVGFPVVVSREVSPAEWQARGARPQAEYVLPVSAFSLEAEDGNQAMAGSALTRGNLLRLSHAVELGRRWLPGKWPGDFASDIAGKKHLDTFNDLWWLKFWRGLVAVERGPKPNPAVPDFDWQLHIRDALAPCTINLEVKRRTANLNAWFKHGTAPVHLRDIADKFQAVPDDTANLAALTVSQPPDPEALRHVAEWLDEAPTVDGLLIWIENNHGREPLLKFIKPAKKWAEFLIAPANPEDLLVASLAWGTLCLPHQVPAFLERLAARLGDNQP